jgi:hypothetical protein
MTEQEWLTCTDPTPMLQFLGGSGKLSERKARLFAVACCRLMWSQLPDQRIRRLVERAEGFADGLATAKGLRAARSAAEGVWDDWRTARAPLKWPFHAHAALVVGEVPIHLHRLCGPGNLTTMSVYRARAARRAGQRAMLPDVFGNPFRPVALAPAWLAWNDGTVVKLAQAIYEDKAFDRLPILADALEEAGCQNQDILGHCRQPGPHVRGCWVVDLLLGKE